MCNTMARYGIATTAFEITNILRSKIYEIYISRGKDLVIIIAIAMSPKTAASLFLLFHTPLTDIGLFAFQQSFLELD